MFCHKCGSKLAEGALFCSQCGSKVPEIIETDNSIEQKIEPITHEITNDSEEERIINLLNKHLKGIVESEKQLLMVPQDEQIINAFPADVIERYTSQRDR